MKNQTVIAVSLGIALSILTATVIPALGASVVAIQEDETVRNKAFYSSYSSKEP